MNRRHVFLVVLGLELSTLGFLWGWGRSAAALDRRERLPARQQLVERLGLTDLSVWTEARYTRHPSQSDLFSPFQDFPSAIDHFPAGSVVAPPDLAPGAATPPVVRN